MAKVQALHADPQKFPGLAKNPALERALRIQQAVAGGKPRAEAVAIAEQAMGRRAPAITAAPAPRARRGPAKAADKPAKKPAPAKPAARPTAGR